jgi:UDP-N-acetylmuramoylalanine--D-glutamate ligase
MTHWQDKRVIIIGAARQGIALACYLSEHGADVVLNDRRPESEFRSIQQTLSDVPIEWVLEGHPLSLLDQADLVCPSGGVPLSISIIGETQNRGIPLSNDSQIFLEDATCKVVGITGSAGKSTTTTLVGRMATAFVEGANRKPASKVWVGGNLGSPLISVVDEVQSEDLAIMELSSFQLEQMIRSPQVAAILNITPNHLDRHKTMEAYTAAKARILEYQNPADVAVLGYDDPGAWALREKCLGEVIGFGLSHPPAGIPSVCLRDDQIILNVKDDDYELFSKELISLRGEHNLLNVMAACAIGYAAGLSIESMQAGVKDFSGMPHRMEFVREWGGAEWYNDSISTAPERAMAAIMSFDEPIILLAGGRDKNLPWNEFASLVKRRIDHIILFGEAAGKIARSIEENQIDQGFNNKRPYTLLMCSDLKGAVQSAAKLVKHGDVVLLSPGGTSFDEFHDFEERGEAYIKWVKELH